MIHTSIQSVCVYCGSRHGGDLAFTHEARALGRGLAEGNMRLIYGAGDVGLMGEVARAALEAGGEALGFIPRHLLDREIGLKDLTAMVVTETMHERKKIMFQNADAAVALPGGAGTLDELIEVLTWRQLGLHQKPLILVDVNGYWSPLIQLLENVVGHGFANADLLDFLTIAPDAQSALEILSKA